MAKMNVTAIILAGGQSQRFGPSNKLFAEHKGSPLIDHCLNTVIDFNFADRLVVTGYEHERVNKHIKRLPVRAVHNADFRQGMGTSLALGVKNINSNCDAFMVFLGDMPDISSGIVEQLVTAFKANENSTIVRPTFRKKLGHPVLFATSHKTELLSLKGDRGASSIFKNHKTSTLVVEVSSPGVIRDIDRSDDLD